MRLRLDVVEAYLVGQLSGSPTVVTRIARFSLDVSNVYCLVATLIFSILLSFLSIGAVLSFLLIGL